MVYTLAVQFTANAAANSQTVGSRSLRSPATQWGKRVVEWVRSLLKGEKVCFAQSAASMKGMNVMGESLPCVLFAVGVT